MNILSVAPQISRCLCVPGRRDSQSRDTSLGKGRLVLKRASADLSGAQSDSESVVKLAPVAMDCPEWQRVWIAISRSFGRTQICSSRNARATTVMDVPSPTAKDAHPRVNMSISSDVEKEGTYISVQSLIQRVPRPPLHIGTVFCNVLYQVRVLLSGEFIAPVEI